jgi:phosphoribosyl 1,2-cyclic phosphodiesterase
MIEICALASGSNGNCYYVGNEEEAVLVDAGLSYKQLIKRMESKSLDPKKIKAVFITHEHGDHIRGVRVLGKKLDIPVYMSKGTYIKAFRTWKPISYLPVENNVPVEVSSFKIFPVLKNHDAAEPVSYRIEYEDRSIGVFTDIGSPCDNVRHHLSQCQALFLETNYDVRMLKEGSYPYYLKVRIDSAVGHLSNLQAFELLKEHAHPELQCVFLSHLSAENNRPELAYKEFLPFVEKFAVRLTDRFAAAEVYILN